MHAEPAVAEIEATAALYQEAPKGAQARLTPHPFRRRVSRSSSMRRD
jgi:hypothetical protein